MPSIGIAILGATTANSGRPAAVEVRRNDVLIPQQRMEIAAGLRQRARVHLGQRPAVHVHLRLHIRAVEDAQEA